MRAWIGVQAKEWDGGGVCELVRTSVLVIELLPSH